MSDTRLEQQLEFCRASGWGGADLFPLPSDASFRTYTRLVDGDRSALLMDAPVEHENLPAFLLVADHLRAHGLRAPRIFARDMKQGLALIEDFGTDTFTRLLAEDPAREEALYLQATEVLIQLHKASTGTNVDVGDYDEKQLLAEVKLLPEWFVPEVRGSTVSETEFEAYTKAWRQDMQQVSADRSALVLRDYHVDNLMIISGGQGLASCGLLDFQDALIGHRAYDLVSLLQDARRDVNESTQTAVRSYYYAEMADIDPNQFEIDLAILGAQRHAKVLGIFARLSRRDNKHIYLKHISRVAALLEKCLQNPALNNVRQSMEAIVPSYVQADLTA